MRIFVTSVSPKICAYLLILMAALSQTSFAQSGFFSARVGLMQGVGISVGVNQPHYGARITGTILPIPPIYIGIKAEIYARFTGGMYLGLGGGFLSRTLYGCSINNPSECGEQLRIFSSVSVLLGFETEPHEGMSFFLEMSPGLTVGPLGIDSSVLNGYEAFFIGLINFSLGFSWRF